MGFFGGGYGVTNCTDFYLSFAKARTLRSGMKKYLVTMVGLLSVAVLTTVVAFGYLQTLF